MVALLRDKRPNFLYFPHKEDIDRHHRLTYQIINKSSWLCSTHLLKECGDKIEKIKGNLLYEIHGPMKQPDYCEDITDFIDIKLRALQCYKTQLSSVRYDEAIKGLNKYRAMMRKVCWGINPQFAEAFQIQRGHEG